MSSPARKCHLRIVRDAESESVVPAGVIGTVDSDEYLEAREEAIGLMEAAELGGGEWRTVRLGCHEQPRRDEQDF